MRATAIGLLLSVALARSAPAYDAYDPANCNGAGWDDKRALTVSKVAVWPRANFVKSPYDDDFTATGCPAATDSSLAQVSHQRVAGACSRRIPAAA